MTNANKSRQFLTLWIVVSFFLVFVPGQLLRSQTSTGQIFISVLDPSGAAIPGAAIKIVGAETGNVVRTLRTSANGDATAPLLPPATYDLTISARGFKTLERQDIALRVGQTVTLHLRLELGSATQSVTVVGKTPLVEEQSTTLASVVGGKQITQMPLNGRNYLQLGLLLPGAVPSTHERDNSFSAYGNPGLENAFLLDGARNVSYLRGLDTQARDAVRPPLDSISQFNVKLSNFSAKFGASAGAVVNVVTKSGTNSIHGSAYDFLRNDHLDAANYFAPAGSKPLLIRNQYGGSLGGPLIRNRAWLFGAYEGTPIKSESTDVSTVPTPQEREGIFGSRAIYDPYSTTANPAGSGYVRTEFPNNTIPTSDFSATGQQILDWYPAPNMPGTSGNYIQNSPTRQSNHNGVTRGDVQLSSKDSMFARYSIIRYSEFQQPALPLPAQTPVNRTIDSYGVGYGYTRTFSPTLVNEFRLGWTRVTLAQDATEKRNEIIPGLLAPKVDSGTPVINVAGYATLGAQAGTNNVPLLKSSGVWDISDNITKTTGPHLLQFGADFQLIRPTTIATMSGRGSMGFTGVFTQNPQSRSGTGSPLADLLLGTANAASTGTTFNDVERGKYLGVYGQDQWKVTPSLTLTLGARYELYFPYTEIHNKMANLVLTPGPLYGHYVLAGLNGQSRSLLTLDKNNVAPRVGFAWTVPYAKALVVRASYGIFYGQDTGLGIIHRMTGTPPFFNYGAISITSDQLFPSSGFILSPTASFPRPAPIDPASFVLDPTSTARLISWPTRYTTPYTQEWNLDIQKQLPWQVLGEISYVGNHGVHFWGSTNANQPLTNGPGSPTTRRPLAAYTVATVWREAPWDRMTYNGLSAKLERRFNRGLYFLTSFTYGQSLNLQDIGIDVGGTNADTIQNGYDIAAQRGPSDYNVPLRFVASATWDPPFGPGRNLLTHGVAGEIIGDWQLSGIYTASSGLPFTLTLPFDNANAGTASWPNRVCNGGLSNPTIHQWFDTSCFVAPPEYQFGNSGKNILYGPGRNNLDIGLDRLFNLQLKDHPTTLEFRMEAFNSLNHPQFGNPGTGIGTPNAGVITGLDQAMRIVQFALRLQF